MSDHNYTWTMPEYLEKYRDLIVNTGGNSIEDLMNDKHTTHFANHVRSAIIVAVKSQIALLESLHERGMLNK
jgi:hypothetical protein